MAVFVLLTTFLIQKGSPESRRPGVKELVDTDPRDFADDPEAPWPVRRGGWILRLYEHSLGLAFVLLFLIGVGGPCARRLCRIRGRSSTHRSAGARADGLPRRRRASGSNRSRTGRASFWRLLPWSGSRCTCDSDGRRNRNPCMRRMPKQDAERTHGDRTDCAPHPTGRRPRRSRSSRKLADDAEADVVVVGAGMTGLTAGVSAGEGRQARHRARTRTLRDDRHGTHERAPDDGDRRATDRAREAVRTRPRAGGLGRGAGRDRDDRRDRS